MNKQTIVYPYLVKWHVHCALWMHGIFVIVLLSVEKDVENVEKSHMICRNVVKQCQEWETIFFCSHSIQFAWVSLKPF